MADKLLYNRNFDKNSSSMALSDATTNLPGQLIK